MVMSKGDGADPDGRVDHSLSQRTDDEAGVKTTIKNTLTQKNTRGKRNAKMKRKQKYDRDMPRRLYTYFASYGDAKGAPSFSKFAKNLGSTLAEIESWRKHSEFDRAWKECNEIRRDYLIDAALGKQFDSSLVKFLLQFEFGMGEKKETDDGELAVTLEILKDESNEA